MMRIASDWAHVNAGTRRGRGRYGRARAVGTAVTHRRSVLCQLAIARHYRQHR